MNSYYKKIHFEYNHKILIDIADKYLDRATEGYINSDGKQVLYDDFDEDGIRGSTTPPKTIFLRTCQKTLDI